MSFSPFELVSTRSEFFKISTISGKYSGLVTDISNDAGRISAVTADRSVIVPRSSGSSPTLSL